MRMTLDSKYTTNVFDNLVQLALSLRPGWQAPGVRAAIRDALNRPETVHVADLTYALTRIACDPTVATPAVLAMDGPHWRKSSQPADMYRSAKCGTCGGRHTPGAEHNPRDRERPSDERRAEMVAACRAGIQPMKTYRGDA